MERAFNTNLRTTVIVSGGILGVVGTVLVFSVAAAVFGLGGLPAVLSRPGVFLAAPFGILAFVVPFYLIAACLILLDSRYRPDCILALGLSVIPFITLVAGVRAFPHGTGSMSVIILLFAEIFGIWAVSQIVKRSVEHGAEHKTADAGEVPAKTYLLTAPLDAEPVDAELDAPLDAELEPVETAEAIITRPAPAPIDFVARVPVVRTPGAAGTTVTGYGDFIAPVEDGAETDTDVGADAEVEFSLPPPPAILPIKLPQVSEKDKLRAMLAKAQEKVEQIDKELAGRGLTQDAVPQTITETSVPPQKKAAKILASTPKSKLPAWNIPVDGVLNDYPDGKYWIIGQDTRDEGEKLKNCLDEFSIQAEITHISKGPVITMFEVLPARGIKLAKIVSLQDNIAMRLEAQSVRIVAPIPGKMAVGIEIPNQKRAIVSFKEIIESELAKRLSGQGLKQQLPVVLGKSITGEAMTIDLAQAPHLLIAGATGSGKSVCVNALLLSILYQLPPADCKLILVDPKIVELKPYDGIPHLLTPVITEPKKAIQALQWCICEMDRRYACLESMGARNIKNYNERIKEKNIATEKMPYIIIIIDEFADLMATTGKELENTVARLAAKSRAVGIHLVLATQRPSTDVITGLIKANLPTRIAFMVSSQIDSRVIIDKVGAEKLLGKGDMLYLGSDSKEPMRMQGAFVSDEEVEKVVEKVKERGGEPEYLDEEMFIEDDEDEDANEAFEEGDDPLYDKAVEIVRQQGKASASFIQRRLKIGYNRSARLVEQMEERGLVGPSQGSKPRELLRA